MKISTEIDSASALVGEHKAVELIAKAGFDAWDFSMFKMAKYNYQEKCLMPNDHPLASANYLKFARELKKIGEDNGIHCNQSHAPFPSYSPDVRSYLKRAIECTAEAGGKICIIHPQNSGSLQENTEMYLELLPFAKECGVKIATENMFNWNRDEDRCCDAACSTPQSFNAMLDTINDDDFVACLDIGHAELSGSGTCAPEMIRALGPRLKALHIHDVDKRYDTHQMPFTMLVDFEAVAKALKEVGYDGYLTLEAVTYLSSYREKTVPEGLKKLAESVRRIDKMIEKF